MVDQMLLMFKFLVTFWAIIFCSEEVCLVMDSVILFSSKLLTTNCAFILIFFALLVAPLTPLIHKQLIITTASLLTSTGRDIVIAIS